MDATKQVASFETWVANRRRRRAHDREAMLRTVKLNAQRARSIADQLLLTIEENDENALKQLSWRLSELSQLAPQWLAPLQELKAEQEEFEKVVAAWETAKEIQK